MCFSLITVANQYVVSLVMWLLNIRFSCIGLGAVWFLHGKMSWKPKKKDDPMAGIECECLDGNSDPTCKS